MTETLTKPPIQEVTVILKPEDPAVLNNQYNKHTAACMALLAEIEILPEITTSEEYQFVQSRLKEINKSYQVKIENRKKITRILDLGISHLMQGEKLLGVAITKWRDKLLTFQLEEKRKSDAKIRAAKELEQRVIAISNGVKQAKLALEGIVLRRRKGLVAQIETLLPAMREKKSLAGLNDIFILSLDKERDTVLGPVFKSLPPEIADEVKNSINRCEDYGLLSFHFRMGHELENMLVGCIGNEDIQHNFIADSDEENYKKTCEAVIKRFKSIYPELNSTFQANTVKIELKSAVTETRATLGTIAASQPELSKGVSDNLEAVIKNREQLLQALNYYLDKTGPEGLTRVFNSLSFVLTLLNKEKPPLPGVLYEERRKVSLR